MNPARLLVLLVSLTLLLGSLCHAEPRTWTAVNGKEVEAEFVSNEKGIVKLKLKSGKVFEVAVDKLSTDDNVFIECLLTPNSINEKDLEFRGGKPWDGGVAYLKDTDTLFNGKAFSTYQNGDKRTEMYIKDGTIRLVLAWYESGQMKSEAFWKNGKMNGSNSAWHENGHKKFVFKMIEGTPDGMATHWYDNGQKEIEMSMTRGVHNGLETRWHRNGKMKGKGYAKNGKAHGLMTLWHENGQMSRQAIFKEGIAQGLTQNWYKNGQKKSEVIYDKGKKEGLFTEWHESGKKKAEANFKADEMVSIKYWNNKGEEVASLEEAEQ